MASSKIRLLHQLISKPEMIYIWVCILSKVSKHKGRDCITKFSYLKRERGKGGETEKEREGQTDRQTWIWHNKYKSNYYIYIWHTHSNYGNFHYKDRTVSQTYFRIMEIKTLHWWDDIFILNCLTGWYCSKFPCGCILFCDALIMPNARPA